MNKTDMSSTTANAATSQFLRLPPEIRSRIYDYVFGSKPVSIQPYLHVEQRPKRVGYKISMCTCEHDHTQLSPRVRFYDHEKDLERVCTEACPNCTAGAAQRSPACKSLSLQSLQVCRQIYHEAALKPFQQASFNYNFDNYCYKGQGLQAFLRALVPVQAKAITHLRLSSLGPTFLKTTTLSKMKGLKHLEIHLDFRIKSSDYVLRVLGRFASDPLVLALAELDAKSIHVDLGLQAPGRRFKEAEALHGRIFKSLTVDDAKVFEEFLKRTETTLLKSLD